MGYPCICVIEINRRIDRRANRTLTSPMSEIVGKPSAENLKRVMASWPTGVGLITTMAQMKDLSSAPGSHPKKTSKPVGILCNSLASISLEKKLILWSVDHSSSSYEYWLEAKTWAVHFLADDQEVYIDTFKKKGVLDKFQDIEFHISKEGNPIIDGAVAILECKSVETFDAFDHTIILGEVLSIENFDKNPMVYAYSKFTPYSSNN